MRERGVRIKDAGLTIFALSCPPGQLKGEESHNLNILIARLPCPSKAFEPFAKTKEQAKMLAPGSEPPK